MIIEVEDDMLRDIKPWSVLMHQVNCLGIAGAGIAKQLRDKYPAWYGMYKRHCDQVEFKKNLLGTVHAMAVGHDVIVCSAFAQLGISKREPVTDYDAWELICPKIESEIRTRNSEKNMNWTLHIPYGIGCGLAGGDWEKMRGIFEYYFGRSPVDLYIHNMPEKPQLDIGRDLMEKPFLQEFEYDGIVPADFRP